MNLHWHPTITSFNHLPAVGIRWLKKVCNLLLVFLGVWVTFYGAVQGRFVLSVAVVSLLLVVHIIAVRDSLIECCTIIMVGIVGSGIEIVNVLTGVYEYIPSADQFALLPTWIIMVWFLLGASIRHFFRSLSKHITVTSFSGAAIVSMIYYIAVKMGAIELTSSNPWLIISPIVLWSVIFPVLTYAGNHFLGSAKTSTM